MLCKKTLTVPEIPTAEYKTEHYIGIIKFLMNYVQHVFNAMFQEKCYLVHNKSL